MWELIAIIIICVFIIIIQFIKLYKLSNKDYTERHKKNFLCNGKKCSWVDLYNEIGKENMMHDYPYYFDDYGNDIYPNKNK